MTVSILLLPCRGDYLQVGNVVVHQISSPSELIGDVSYKVIMQKPGFELPQRGRKDVLTPDIFYRGQVDPAASNEMTLSCLTSFSYLLQENGKPYNRGLFWNHFDEQRKDIPELADVTLHGLRCTAVINLRRAGLQISQISDVARNYPALLPVCGP